MEKIIVIFCCVVVCLTDLIWIVVREFSPLSIIVIGALIALNVLSAIRAFRWYWRRALLAFVPSLTSMFTAMWFFVGEYGQAPYSLHLVGLVVIGIGFINIIPFTSSTRPSALVLAPANPKIN